MRRPLPAAAGAARAQLLYHHVYVRFDGEEFVVAVLLHRLPVSAVMLYTRAAP